MVPPDTETHSLHWPRDPRLTNKFYYGVCSKILALVVSGYTCPSFVMAGRLRGAGQEVKRGEICGRDGILDLQVACMGGFTTLQVVSVGSALSIHTWAS
jgi:hypothetical protein